MKRAEAEEAKAEHASLLAQLEGAGMMEDMARAKAIADRADMQRVWDYQRDKSHRSNWDLEDPSSLRKSTLPRSPLPVYLTGERPHASAVQILEAERREDPNLLRSKKLQFRADMVAGMVEKETLRAAAAQEMYGTAISEHLISQAVKEVEEKKEADKRAEAAFINLENKAVVSLEVAWMGWAGGNGSLLAVFFSIHAFLI